MKLRQALKVVSQMSQGRQDRYSKEQLKSACKRVFNSRHWERWTWCRSIPYRSFRFKGTEAGLVVRVRHGKVWVEEVREVPTQPDLGLKLSGPITMTMETKPWPSP